VTLTLLKDTI